MRVLYYTWYENSKDDTLEALQRMNVEVTLLDGSVTDYDADVQLEQRIMDELEKKAYNLIFTYDYFPFLTNVAEQKQIPYAAWVYDCPHRTLCSKKVTSGWNYIFVFDRKQCEGLRKKGVVHAYHLPLAVNTQRLNRQSAHDRSNDCSQISFVGSLYEHCMYEQIHYLPQYLSGFLDALLAVQKNVWGYDFFSELLTQEHVKELEKYIHLPSDERYNFSSKDIFVEMMQEKRTSMDRIESLLALGNYFPVDLYTASDIRLDGRVTCRGTVTYMEEMPRVFCHSKINLNLTLRSITSGIPLRALDIMGAGGFLLSNLQPELEEYFVEGEDFAAFRTQEELCELCDWYLRQDSERAHILQSGHEKVRKYFSYEQQLQKLIQIVRHDS